MKTLLTLALLSIGLTASAQPLTIPVLDPGLYQGVITVQRQVPDLRTTDTTTLLINAEVFSTQGNGVGASIVPAIIWTARNFDTNMKLANAWGSIQFGTLQFPGTIPDMPLSGTNHTIFGGTLVPGSYKNTRTTLAWKCTKETTLFMRRKSVITTSFSINRVSSLSLPP